MLTAPRAPERISTELIETICGRLADDRRVRRFLPGGGIVHLERRLPFLCFHREDPERPDPGTSSLVAGQSAYLVGPGGKEHVPGLSELLARITALLGEEFGAFLLLEVWTADRRSAEDSTFTIVAPNDDEIPMAVEKLADALAEVRVPEGQATVSVRKAPETNPPSLPRLLPPEHLGEFAVLPLGLEIQPFFRDLGTGALYPRTLRELQRTLSIALQRGFYEFVRLETTHRPANYHVLGRGAILRVVREADRELAAVDEAFDFLLAVTPTNLDEAWERFRDSGFGTAPPFRYRLLTFDPSVLKRRLYNIVLDPLEDPALADLFRDKRNELDLQLTMLENRDTPRFLYAGLQLYGRVHEPLLKLAEGLLTGLPAPSGEPDAERTDGEMIDAEGFARLARAEVEAYRRQAPEFDPAIRIREDVPSLMVSRGDLLVAAGTRISRSRALALIQHEVGTHMLTYFNGSQQGLHLIRCGFPGYEELQEGLAVLAEYLVGGLSQERIRLLAARVLASHRCSEGADFVETFGLLHREHGFSARTAFQVTIRVYRGGGFIKDQVYLRGLARLLEYLGSDGALTPLWVGKIGFEHVKVVEELLWRGVLEPPVIQPRYLEMKDARRKLEALRTGVSVLDLITKEEGWRSVSS